MHLHMCRHMHTIKLRLIMHAPPPEHLHVHLLTPKQQSWQQDWPSIEGLSLKMLAFWSSHPDYRSLILIPTPKSKTHVALTPHPDLLCRGKPFERGGYGGWEHEDRSLHSLASISYAKKRSKTPQVSSAHLRVFARFQSTDSSMKGALPLKGVGQGTHPFQGWGPLHATSKRA